MPKSILRDKSYAFAIAIVKACQHIQKEQKEFVLSKQVLRSGTAIGALIVEAEFGQSKPDFIHKLSIALKEANETKYWLSIMYDTDYLDREYYDKLDSECKEIVAMLVASIKTLKAKNQ